MEWIGIKFKDLISTIKNMFVCEYCNSTFKTSSNLNKHKYTAKFCFRERNNLNIVIKCEYCEKEFNSNISLQNHFLTCIDKFKKENANLNLFKQKYDDLFLENKKLKEEINLLTSDNKKLVFEKEQALYKLEILNKDKVEFEKTLIKYETSIQFINEENKNKNKEIKLLKDENKLILDKYSQQVKNIYNNTQINNYSSVEYSQKNFDRIVDNKYTYQLFNEGSKGAQKLIINFIYHDSNIKEVIVSDNARDKIKITDNLGQTTYIDFDQLSNLCRESLPLTNLIKQYTEQFFKENENKPEDPFDPLVEQASQKNQVFRRKKLRTVYKDVKSFIKKGQGALLIFEDENEEKNPT